MTTPTAAAAAVALPGRQPAGASERPRGAAVTALAEQVLQVFAADGRLARAQPQFRPRAGQTRMALAVAQIMETGGALVVEAGTGVGKTFAYLVPALLSGERVLLSTATKALQDQLFARDLPLLTQTLALPLRSALLKGRASYLCLQRMEQARQHPAAQNPGVARLLAQVEGWARHTQSGDLAELAGLDERSPALALVTSTRENCLGSNCPRLRDCHVYRARREALAADLLVVNHHLFFADLALRESGMAQLLPTLRVLVFDEAHQINETGVQFLGTQLSTGQLLDYGRDLLAAGLLHARGMADWGARAGLLERSAAELRLAAAGPQWGAGLAQAEAALMESDAAAATPPGQRLRWTGPAPQGLAPERWQGALRACVAACAQARTALAAVCESAPELLRLHERGGELLDCIAHFCGPADADAVRWLDLGAQQLRLIEAPLDIAQAMQTRLLDAAAPQAGAAQAQGDAGAPAGRQAAPERSAEPGAQRGRAWIFTSATLGDDERLSWFTARAGLHDAQILRVASPFDYAAQAALYVPPELPAPADPAHSSALAQWLGDAAATLGGRTLVLTTTLKALRTIGAALKARFEALPAAPDAAAAPALQILVQGEWPKRRLMERFRAGRRPGLPGCILVASASFWEGFDVPGDALQLLVIDKLPFPPPGDPLVEAHTQRLEKAGTRAFTGYALPEAAVALKQGAGRLIRHESDRGILVIADRRLLSMGYGKRLLAALPPMRRLTSRQEFDAALCALNRPAPADGHGVSSAGLRAGQGQPGR